MDVDIRLERYFARLGLTERPAATLESLREVHRAHVARIPYDNLSIMLGRPDPIAAADSVSRVGSCGRLGYCFHQNSALEWLLTELGFSVSRRHGHVWARSEHHLGPDGWSFGIGAGHHDRCTSADSPFRRIVVAQRIEGERQHAVRGLVHQVRTPAHRDQRDLTTYDEWRAALVDDLLLPVADVTDDEWASLWQRSLDAHRAWDQAGRP